MRPTVLAALLVLSAGAGRAAPPACLAEASLEPERAFAGQQVIYRLRILRRPEVGAVRWEQALAFPSFRSEWLPGRQPDPDIDEVGAGHLVYEERRALFPARAGGLEIPEARLRCALEGDDAPGEVVAAIPALSLRVDPLPARGRPDDFDELVGPLRLEAAIAPARIALGEAARLSIHLIGGGNVWSAAAPLDPEAILTDVDVFAHPPELLLDPGERLRARRSFRYDLVPRRTGRVEIPDLEVPYFDPIGRRYARARSDAVGLEVGPARPAAASPPAAPAANSAEAPEPVPKARRPSRLPWLVGLAGMALVGAVWLRRRRGRRDDPVEEQLAAAARAEARGDVEAARAALERALREALAQRMARDGAPDRLVERPAAGTEAWIRLVGALERARFGGGDADAPDVATVRAALRGR